ncbi:MAG: response regulator [Sulfitobacter sp.]|nr:response regulator [Sulfitobacter sp.]
MSLANKLTEERRARLAAERLLELKQAELFAANRKLGLHAQRLSEKIVRTRAEVENMRGENQRVKSDLSVANRRVAVTERRLWHTIETINDGFAFFNGDYELIMANRAYIDIFDGLESIRPGVNYVTILQALTDEGIVNTGDMTPAAWRQMMTERVQADAPEPVVIKLWDHSHMRLIDRRGPGGDLVTLGLDITATVKYEEQLKEARAMAESASRAKSAFLANMSHEIRTPMNGVVGMAEVLGETELDEDQRLYVDTIRRSGEALLVIINDVLDNSKIEASRLELNPEPFDLKASTEEVLRLLEPSARDKGLTLHLDYDHFLPSRLIGDPGRLRQVMTNLVGNAVKFTAEGSVTVRATGVPDHVKGRVTVHMSVEDTGIGIPKDQQERIFGDFNQVENERNRQFDGTGLGLSITQRLIELMGGRIWLTSEEGLGSCFGFIVELGVADEEAAPVTVPFVSKRKVRRRIKVLAAEDNKTNQLVLRKLLKELDLELVFANNGEEAVQLFQETDPDLIFMDISMPRMDGKEATQSIRKLEECSGRRVPIIAMTAHAMAGDEKQILAAGLDHYLTKPLRKAALIEQIEAVLDDRFVVPWPAQEAG